MKLDITETQLRVIKFVYEKKETTLGEISENVVNLGDNCYGKGYNEYDHVFDGQAFHTYISHMQNNDDWCKGIVNITREGELLIENLKREKKDLWLVNAKIPFAVSLITTILANILTYLFK